MSDKTYDMVKEEEEKESPMTAEDYVRGFMKELGYAEDYEVKDGYDRLSDRIAREYTLEMPNDTAARDVNGDVVIALVSSGDEKSEKVGRRLGDIMMKGDSDTEKLLSAMQEAFSALNELSSEEESEKSKSFDESIGGMSLYDRASMFFKVANGINEDGSDYGFDDYVRESLTSSEKIEESGVSDGSYFGGYSMVESMTMDDFDTRFTEWTNGGSRREDLSPSSTDTPERAEFKRRMLEILSKSRNTRMDSNNDGFVNQKEYKRYNDNIRDINGRISNEQLFANGMREVRAGINSYLNKFMPMSWINTMNQKIDKGVGTVYDKIGGGRALAGGALGGLMFGPVGAVGGALLGKMLQRKPMKRT